MAGKRRFALVNDGTAPRGLVHALLVESRTPLTAYQILAQLQSRGVPYVQTVYRALDFLVTTGAVHRLESINAYVACRNCKTPHQPVFVICRSCGRASEFRDANVDAVVHGIRNRKGFEIDRTSVEIVGTCARCLAARPKRPPKWMHPRALKRGRSGETQAARRRS